MTNYIVYLESVLRALCELDPNVRIVMTRTDKGISFYLSQSELEFKYSQLATITDDDVAWLKAMQITLEGKS